VICHLKSHIASLKCAVSFTLVFPLTANAIAPGFYSSKTDSADSRELARVFQEADTTIYSYGMNRFHVKPSGRNLSRQQVLKQLKTKSNKKLLLFSFENNGWRKGKDWPLGGVTYTSEQIGTYKLAIERLRSFIKKLGYQRVVFVTPTMSNVMGGEYLLKDQSISL
jgi:hypothetical protein